MTDPDPAHPDVRDAPGAPARAGARRDVVTAMQRLTTESQRVAQAFAAQQGLGHIDLEALLHVMQAEQRGDPVTSGRLGDVLGVTSGAATGVIDRLERAGHVHRTRDEVDRRRVIVRYDEAARAVAGRFFGPLGALSDRVMAGYDDAELQTVRRFLGEMAAAMGEHARTVGRPDPDPDPTSSPAPEAP
ncbi:MarR family winged helix-turn-helix transcriptional regulator [Frigoribacterium endophyticum]|uniref:MarR family winged helix-turn-helix transcriptional regulator n=1 Tax=Frigoribacterium endophyticum TaxID=1522176 RepID=UPI00141DBDE3|nr:MarR family winged helix-turn-helix transcriptional regulator [Frigoribacterium endophyticum]NII49980.1 DNA-binding MarR family transcriptional regulator [Frigoribacterium endophyticum]